MEHLYRAVRTALRRPGFSLTVILAIALGIGAVTAVFQVVYSALLQPLPYPDAERFVLLTMSRPQAGAVGGRVSVPDVRDWRDRSQSLSHVAALSDESFVVSDLDPPLRVPGAQVTADFFRVLQREPLVGSVTGWDDPGAHLAVLSHRFWTDRLGRDPQIVGQRLVLNDQPHDVVGILPPDVRFPRDAEILTSLDIAGIPAAMRGARYLRAVGRLAPEVSLAQARDELATLSRELASTYPETNEDQVVTPVPLREYLVGDLRPGMVLLLAAVGLVLLIVCINLAGLLLARGTARLDEMRVRTALGATGRQIVWSLLLENVVLASIGGLVGILAGVVASRALISLYPESLPEHAATAHPVVVAVCLGVALFAGLLFSLPAAWMATRQGIRPTSTRGANASAMNRFTLRSQATILVAQLAVTLALLVTAGSVLYSLNRLLAVDPGFTSQNLLTARISLPSSRYPEPFQRAAFFRDLLQQARGLPGVDDAAAVTNLPLSGSNMIFAATLEGRPSDSEPPRVHYRAASPGYFHTLGVPVVEGRGIETRDEAGTEPVVVVNQTFARQHFSQTSPVGQRIRIPFGDGEPMTIVGVVGDIHHASLEAAPQPEIYVPYMQQPWGFMTLVLRSEDLRRIVPLLRATVHRLDEDQPIDQIRTMEELVSASVARPRFFTVLLGTFAFLALLTAVVGLYGLASFWVHLRLEEVGIRMALGAEPRTVRRQFLGRPLMLALAGTALGVALALVLGRGLSGLLYDIEPGNPWTLALASLFLLAVTLVATYLPARRASRVDPIRVLRHE